LHNEGVIFAMHYRAYGLLSRALVLGTLVASLGLPSAAAAQPYCTFTFGFKALHDAIPDVVGDCVEDAQPDGTAATWQHTTRGLLRWILANSGYQLTLFTPRGSGELGEYPPSYRLETKADCASIHGIYLPSGVCITIQTTVVIPQSTLDAGVSGRAICQQDDPGNQWFEPRFCMIRRPNG
jgi:hypothetical protein